MDHDDASPLDIACELPPDPIDAEASEVLWPGCEVVGTDCLPTDTTIFVTNCVAAAGETPTFSPACPAGRCNCGFVEWEYPCDMGTCSTGPSDSHADYCATGPRILCARGAGEYADTRAGCCDDAGWVYCERDPRPGSNLCVDGCAGYPLPLALPMDDASAAARTAIVHEFSALYPSTGWGFWSTGDVRSLLGVGAVMSLPGGHASQEDVDRAVRMFIEEWRDLFGFGSEGFTIRRFHSTTYPTGIEGAMIEYERATITGHHAIEPLFFHANIDNFRITSLSMSLLRQPRPEDVRMCDRYDEAGLRAALLGRSFPLGPDGSFVFGEADGFAVIDEGLLPCLRDLECALGEPAALRLVYEVNLWPAADPGCPAWARVDAASGTVLQTGLTCDY